MAREKRLHAKDYDNLLKVIEQVYEIKKPDEFQKKALLAVGQLVSSDYLRFNEIPRSILMPGETVREPLAIGVSSSAGQVPHHQAVIFSKYAHQHPSSTYFKKTQDGRPYRISDFLTQKQFHRLDLYNEYYRLMGTEYQIHFWLSTKNETLVGISMNRSIRDFNERDRLILNLIRPHLLRAYQNAVIHTRFHQERTLLEGAIEQEERGIIQVDWEGNIQFITAFAKSLLTRYFNTVSQSQCLPFALQKWLASLSSSGRRSNGNQQLVFVTGEKNLLIQCLQADTYANPILLLREVDASNPHLRSAESLGLTPREGEVLHWVAMGKTNQEIGLILDIQIGTVKKHLEHIYEKLGVETRTAAASVYQCLPSKR